jgi:uncharacterized protein (DUF885 family)
MNAVATAQAVDSLARDFLADYFNTYPAIAAGLGLHEYDGRVSDLSQTSVAARLKTLRSFVPRLVAIDPTVVGDAMLHEYELLRWRIGAELWTLNEAQPHRFNPLSYAGDAVVDGYLKRSYAPLPERIDALTRHLAAVPGLLETARSSLDRHLPQVLIEEAILAFEGLSTFLREGLPEALSKLHGMPPADEVLLARDRALSAIQRFNRYLRKELLPQADTEFAYGNERLAAMLHAGELIDVPLSQILALGYADLSRNRTALIETAREIDSTADPRRLFLDLGDDYPQPRDLLAEAAACVEEIFHFVNTNQLLSLPRSAPLRIAPMPPFARRTSAMLDPAGPFENAASESFFYLRLPDRTWPHQQVAEWMRSFGRSLLTMTCLHETYPGHHVQSARMHQAPGRLGPVFQSSAHIEGWAHYAEEMVLAAGYGDQNPRLHLAQIGESLLRNCRLICAIEMHTNDMTIEQAAHMFEENAMVSAAVAQREARRGAVDPASMNYTLGKLLLLRLRDDCQVAWGATYSLRRFHDEYLGFGAPPLPLLRGLLLD